MPYVGLHLLQWLEPPYADPTRQNADAIVVLGGGNYFSAPEYGSDTVNGRELERLRYAAWLRRRLGKPLMVTGGSPEGGASEAPSMKSVLEQEFQVPVRWMEDASRTTDENARFTYRVLGKDGVRRIYLVTHASHMPRAAAAFERAGFTVVPAPTAFSTHYRTTIIDFLPSARALRDSAVVCHEVIGIAWYWLKSRISRWMPQRAAKDAHEGPHQMAGKRELRC